MSAEKDRFEALVQRINEVQEMDKKRINLVRSISSEIERAWIEPLYKTAARALFSQIPSLEKKFEDTEY